MSNIVATIKRYMSLPEDELKNKPNKAWEYARTYHARENFTKEFRRVINEIISAEQAKKGD